MRSTLVDDEGDMIAGSMVIAVVAQVTKIGSEGQVTIPAELREEFGLAEGDPMVVELRDGVIVVRRATIVEQTAGFGAPWRVSPPLTRDEEKQAFERAVAEENSRYE
jgi:AbrB family looped-hinge helix DNA binding protein